LDEDVSTLFEEIGHDGSEILWPDAEFPNDRRGFHLQELIECCLHRGWAVTPIEPRPALFSPEMGKTYEVNMNPSERIPYHMKNKVGVLQGTISGGRHAVAWDGESIVDPSGRSTNLRDFNMQYFYLLTRII
jgi:hypothetical protein